MNIKVSLMCYGQKGNEYNRFIRGLINRENPIVCIDCCPPPNSVSGMLTHTNRKLYSKPMQKNPQTSNMVDLPWCNAGALAQAQSQCRLAHLSFYQKHIYGNRLR